MVTYYYGKIWFEAFILHYFIFLSWLKEYAIYQKRLISLNYVNESDVYQFNGTFKCLHNILLQLTVTNSYAKIWFEAIILHYFIFVSWLKEYAIYQKCLISLNYVNKSDVYQYIGTFKCLHNILLQLTVTNYSVKIWFKELILRLFNLYSWLKTIN